MLVAGRSCVTDPSQPGRAHPPLPILARMTDTATKPWIRRKTTIIGFVLIAFIAWTLAAQEWTGKDCGTWQGYGLVIEHFGTPDHYEGCESEPDGPAYTDNYGD